MIILGIDPGLAKAGYAVLEHLPPRMRLIDCGTINTKAGLPLPERLSILYDSMEQLIDMFKPDEVAFEELFFVKNVTTGIDVAQARGALVTAAYRKVKKLYEYTPMQVKQAVTGYGRAEKAQVQYMVKTILALNAVPKPDDAADAVAVAICHAQSRGLPRGLGAKR